MNITDLKRIKNRVIGNPSAKAEIANDNGFISKLVESVVHGENEGLRTEAANIVGSIALGTDEAVFSLLRADALTALVTALGNEPTLAHARALKTLAGSLASLVGPSQWGLRPEPPLSYTPSESLNRFYALPSTDLWLPLLDSPSTQISSTIASLIATSLIHESHRTALTFWVPPSERAREEQVRARRGWEKRAWEKSSSSASASGAVSGGTAVTAGWVLTRLLDIGGFERKSRVEPKTLEFALLAVAALAKDNPTVAGLLVRPIVGTDGHGGTPLLTVLAHARSRLPDVQIAACLCATHIIRSVSSIHSPPVDDISTAARTIVNVVGRMITPEDSDGFSHIQKSKACFILYYLTTDDPTLSELAFERGSHAKLALLLQTITPCPSSDDSQGNEEWEEDEPGSISALREAALTALASISLFSNDIRRSLTEDTLLPPPTSSPDTQQRHTSLLTILSVSLSSPHIGIRYGACQCVRALSRSVAVLRTNITDSGVGVAVFRLVMGKRTSVNTNALGTGTGKSLEHERRIDGVEHSVYRGEDRRVLGAALRAVCNAVCDFSPLRQMYLDQGLIPRLVELVENNEDGGLRLSAIWAIKNLLRKTTLETKKAVMKELGWKTLIELLEYSEPPVQEQGFNILRNLSENEESVEMVFEHFDVGGPQTLFNLLDSALDSGHDDLILQASHALANLINGPLRYHTRILTHPTLLQTLRTVLSESKSEIRRPVVSCILELVRANPKCRKELVDAGIASTLRHICEWSGAGREMGVGHRIQHQHHGGTSPAGLTHAPSGMPRSPVSVVGGLSLRVGQGASVQSGGGTGGGGGTEDDRDVVDTARVALDWLEHGDGYSTRAVLLD